MIFSFLSGKEGGVEHTTVVGVAWRGVALFALFSRPASFWHLFLVYF